MAATTKAQYETDFVEWTDETAKLLRVGRFRDIDIDNLIEEVEGLGRSERSAVQSQLARMLMHLIKQRVQPERAGDSWRSSIIDAQREIFFAVKRSPSLKRFLADVLDETYQRALKDAIEEMDLPRKRAAEIPPKCPWPLDELLEGKPK
jgi:hypothetical protein